MNPSLTDEEASRRLEISRVLPASPRRIFEAWLDPQALASFIRPDARVTVPTVEVDARVGGQFLILMQIGDKEFPHRGEYRQIEPYSLLSFTWHSVYSIPNSLVTIELEEIKGGQTRLRLVHVGFSNDEYRGNHERGWAAIIETLTNHL